MRKNPLYSKKRMSEHAGFREREHTADWELEAWGPDFLSLIVQAAQGMYALSGTHLQKGERVVRRFTIVGSDPEILLVRFLDELLYYGEQENLGFDRFDLVMQDDHLIAEVYGSKIVRQDKLIKAVTYHNLAVREAERGLEVNVVFDV